MYKEHIRKKPWVMGGAPLPYICGKTVVSPLHYGETVEIMMIRGVEGTVTINGRPFSLREENVFFIPPRQLHTAVYSKGGEREESVIAALHIAPEMLLPYLDLTRILMSEQRPLTSISTVCGNFEQVYGLSLQLIKTESLLDGICILLQLIRALIDGSSTQPEIIANDRYAGRIVDFVEANYACDLTVEKAAAYFGFNPNYFCKWIKQHTGTTFNCFLNAVRINHACADLLLGYSCAQTAEQCGYNDPSYFVKVFRRIMGVTPREYVQQNLESIVKTS